MALTSQWVSNQFPDLSQITPIGHGGQKAVFAALHPSDGDVVIKVIHPQTPISSVEREVLAVRQAGSARVPQVHDMGIVTDGSGVEHAWIREQRISGATLRRRITGGPLPPDQVLRLGVQLLETLACAERARLVHRDVKPENIMVDTDGDFWLLDFGIARHLAMPPETATSAPFGKFTPGYAPPEQFRNLQSQIDSRADLFAVGVTVYEAATGVNPFRQGAASDLEVLQRVDRRPFPQLTLACAAHESLRDLVDAMTKMRRDHRPRSVQEALDWMIEVAARGLAL